jgi:single-strand DNA-binding protein
MANVFTGLVRVGNEPEVRTLSSGRSVLSFSAASTTGYGDRKQTLWLSVSYWNNPEKVASFLSKGDQLVISGELSQREYESNGQSKTSLELNATILDLVGGRRESNAAPPQQRQTASPAPAYNEAGYEDDIPF